jgi:ADP-heptose:LPS heptosyltransferase/SAM-dependent methyltransferase
MYLMESPRGRAEEEIVHGHKVVDGRVMLFKQYWWHYFSFFGWRDITPPGLGRGTIKPQNMKRVLFEHHSAFGDMLFLTPVLRAYAKKYPGVHLRVETSPKGALVLEGNPWVTETALTNGLPEDSFIDKFDDAMNFDGMLPMFPQCELINVYDLFAEWAGIELQDDEKKPELYFHDNEEARADEILTSWGFNERERYVMIQYDASSYIRSIPYATTMKLAEKIAADGYKVILFGRGDLDKKAQWECAKCGTRNFTTLPQKVQKARLTCSCGQHHDYRRPDQAVSGIYFTDSKQVNIRIIALLIRRAAAFIGPDSVGIHLAACFDRPTLGIFFSFDGDLRMRYYRHARCMQIEVPCGPCFQHGRRRCINGTRDGFPRCVENLTAGQIYGEFLKVIGGDYGITARAVIPPQARRCPVCGDEERKYICRKKVICYYECLRCGVIYSGMEATEPAERVARYSEGLLPVMIEMRLRGIALALHKKFFRTGARALEVGCERGFILNELQQKGWEVEGLSRSSSAMEDTLRQYPHLAGKITSGPFPSGVYEKKYTLLWMNKAFERFHEPRAIFSHVHGILEEEGIFALQAHDGDHWREALLRPKWKGINPSYAGENSIIPHEASLRLLGDQAGFECLGKEATHDPECLVIMFRKASRT